MTAELTLVDDEALADLGRYAARARALDADGAMRLQALGHVLASWVSVLPGSGLLGEGTVLGLRTTALAEPASVDLTVALGAITDRTARPDAGRVLPLPPATVAVTWSALTPPRSGWALAATSRLTRWPAPLRREWRRFRPPLPSAAPRPDWSAIGCGERSCPELR